MKPSILFFVLSLINIPSMAAETRVPLDKVEVDLSDGLSLQRGAKTYINYCLGCHEASYMRYNRLTDLGLSENDIKKYLIFDDRKVGDTMTNSMSQSEGKQWFGVPPPDLSVISRSKGSDYLYTYLRSFYRDNESPTGWNNLLFPNVSMPHILWELQGIQTVKLAESSNDYRTTNAQFILDSPGQLSPKEYDSFIRDLVNYLVFMGEPGAANRVRIGIGVIFVLALLLVLSMVVKREYWKDIK